MTNQNYKSLRIFFIFLIFIIVSLLVLTSCEKQRITSEEFEEKDFVIEKRSVQIDPLQNEEVFLGIRNKGEAKAKFSFFISCDTPDCDQKITSQFFPSVEVEAGQKIAIPILFYVSEDAEAGEYTLNIEVKKAGEIIGQEKFTVQVLETVEEKKRDLLGE